MRTLAGLVQVSRELVEDSDVDALLTRILGDVVALRLDLAALYGTGTAPEPRGVKNTAGILTASMGANDAALTNYDRWPTRWAPWPTTTSRRTRPSWRLVQRGRWAS